MAGILFIISAPSGSGKSTLVAQVRSLVEGLEFSISYTTRSPRGSELDGREYYFISRERFERMIFLTSGTSGAFIEKMFSSKPSNSRVYRGSPDISPHMLTLIEFRRPAR